MTPPIPPPIRELAIVNARGFTANPRRPWIDALLVCDGRIMLLGASAEVRKRTGATVPVVDAKGGSLLPSFMSARTESAFTASVARHRDGGERALRSGVTANLVLLDRDISQADGDDAGEARVVLRITAGVVLHDPGGLLGR